MCICLPKTEQDTLLHVQQLPGGITRRRAPMLLFEVHSRWLGEGKPHDLQVEGVGKMIWTGADEELESELESFAPSGVQNTCKQPSALACVKPTEDRFILGVGWTVIDSSICMTSFRQKIMDLFESVMCHPSRACASLMHVLRILIIFEY